MNPGDVLGICQASQAPSSPEPLVEGVSVRCSQGDLVKNERGLYCGFVRLQARSEADYQYCLVKLRLRKELESRFRLVRAEVTVQTKTSVWVELEAKNGRSSFGKYLPKDGRIATANSITDNETVRRMCTRCEESKEEEEDSSEHMEVQEPASPKASSKAPTVQSPSKRSAQEAQNAYDSMLQQIDQDMKVNTVVPEQQLDERMMTRVYRGLVGTELVVPEGGSVLANLFLHDDEIQNLKCLLKLSAVVTNNEEFKYFNNCYDIGEQTVAITNGICRTTKTTRPCVKVRVTNPRCITADLKTDSPIALIRIQLKEDEPPSPKPARSSAPLQLPAVSRVAELRAPPPLQPPPAGPRKPFNTSKHLEKVQRKVGRRWEQLCSQDVWEKSLTVEERYPFFSRLPKLKTPFGLKDKELNMRVGTSQSIRPVKVLDRVNGVFTCFICDVVVLDKYSCQDHWYSAKHKDTMAQVQVIAGPEERLAMGRPVVLELLGQWALLPLLGLDRVVEVLQGRRPPYYRCTTCGPDLGLRELVPHLASPHHILAFLKLHFPAAWARFASSPDPERWQEADFAVMEQVVAKVEAVHGRKRPGMAASDEDLAGVLEKLPAAPYSGKVLDSFFKSLPLAEAPTAHSMSSLEGEVLGRARLQEAALAEGVEVAGGGKQEAVVRVLGTFSTQLAGRWVMVGQGQEGGLRVQAGLSRLWLDDMEKLCLRLSLLNPGGEVVAAREHTRVATVRWREVEGEVRRAGEP